MVVVVAAATAAEALVTWTQRGTRGEAGRSAVHSRLFFALAWLRRPQARARSLRLPRGDLPGADNQTLRRTPRRVRSAPARGPCNLSTGRPQVLHLSASQNPYSNPV
ncbi:unnamed protein product [Rangifer tarandus platyrhynchus]|uniref:Uncharacterized protein n=2 Tax=Rangifer tarandus platyrhynchus TaxID=3082113 RepID=A0ACB0F8N9_RANTA|nr:unnamed protein product [Rangifer tarandus platyrhynchus]CAI9709405.1 unnamed protein product [Rangifer tarandus platyrhynchus]